MVLAASEHRSRRTPMPFREPRQPKPFATGISQLLARQQLTLHRKTFLRATKSGLSPTHLFRQSPVRSRPCKRNKLASVQDTRFATEIQPAFSSRFFSEECAESSCSSHRCRWKAAFKSSFFSCPDRCRRSRRTHPQSLHRYTLRLASRTSARTENLPPAGCLRPLSYSATSFWEAPTAQKDCLMRLAM